MTTTSHRPMDAYRHYPEKNPYDILHPPVYNLVPYPEVDDVDTLQLKQVARDVANRTGINVLYGMYGQYPLLMAELDELEVYENPVPFSGYRRPPPLSKTSLPDDVAFVQQVNAGGNTPIFVVSTGGVLRLLKIYPEVYIDESQWRRNPFDEDQPIDPVKLFKREKETYAHLLHAGVCEKGLVPNCYGWLKLSAAHVKAIARLAPDLTYCQSETLEDPRRKVRKGRPPKGILLEYFPDAQTISIDNVTHALAERAVRSLHAIHAAYVRHGDIKRQNILVLPGGRVVWVDFNSAMCASDRQLTRWDLYMEFQEGWDTFYMHLLPDKRIGFHQWIE